MPNGVKSAGTVARLSSTKKLSSHRRKYPSSTETRGSTSCWTETPNSQSAGRTPHPSSAAGSKFRLKVAVPKLRSLIAPHESPPAARLFCASGLDRLQSGMKLPLPSVHERVIGGRPSSVLPAMRDVGLVIE